MISWRSQPLPSGSLNVANEAVTAPIRIRAILSGILGFGEMRIEFTCARNP